MDAQKTRFESVEIFGKPAIVTGLRIDRSTIPEGYHAYDIRHGDDWGKPCSVEDRGLVNHYGTIVLNRPLSLGRNGFRRIRGGDLSHADSRACSLADYMKEHPSRQKEMER